MKKLNTEFFTSEYCENTLFRNNSNNIFFLLNTDSSETDGQKRWYCETCPQNFTSVNSLKEHELTHDADKPYVCILCEKDFALKSSLSRHILASHGVDPSPIIDSDKCLKKSVAAKKQTEKIANERNREISESSFSPQVCVGFFFKSYLKI